MYSVYWYISLFWRIFTSLVVLETARGVISQCLELDWIIYSVVDFIISVFYILPHQYDISHSLSIHFSLAWYLDMRQSSSLKTIEGFSVFKRSFFFKFLKFREFTYMYMYIHVVNVTSRKLPNTCYNLFNRPLAYYMQYFTSYYNHC